MSTNHPRSPTFILALLFVLVRLNDNQVGSCSLTGGLVGLSHILSRKPKTFTLESSILLCKKILIESHIIYFHLGYSLPCVRISHKIVTKCEKHFEAGWKCLHVSVRLCISTWQFSRLLGEKPKLGWKWERGCAAKTRPYIGQFLKMPPMAPCEFLAQPLLSPRVYQSQLYLQMLT